MKESKNNLFKTYFSLTKPGIIFGNLITATAGFFLASRGEVSIAILISVLSGTSLIIASACVFNNYLDRDIDSHMSRTKNRALVTHSVSVKNAIIYAFILGFLGVLILLLGTNFLTLGIGILGFIFYVFIYGYAKRNTVYGTLVGSISGATPPVAGYVAVTNRFDIAALLLFIILVVWQMPHFYSIAIFRLKDYQAAKIPVLPIKRGINFTKITMVGYIVLFLLSIVVLSVAHFVGLIYLVILVPSAIYWLILGVKGFSAPDDSIWARKMFKLSLRVITIFSILISIDWVR